MGRATADELGGARRVLLVPEVELAPRDIVFLYPWLPRVCSSYSSTRQRKAVFTLTSRRQQSAQLRAPLRHSSLRWRVERPCLRRQ